MKNGLYSLLKILGVLMLSLLYVIFLPVIGVFVLCGLVAKKLILFVKKPDSTVTFQKIIHGNLGVVLPDGGEPHGSQFRHQKDVTQNQRNKCSTEGRIRCKEE